MTILRYTLAFSLLASTCALANAAVTLTEGIETAGTETAPVYHLENQWMKVAVIKGAASTGNATAVGQVLALYKKTGAQPTVSQLGALGNPRISQASSFIAFRDRISSSDPVVDGRVVTGTVDAGGTVAEVNVTETSGVATIAVQKTYRLRDNAKWLEVSFRWVNSGGNYQSGTVGSGVESIIYAAPGGTSGNNNPGDEQFAKTMNGLVAATTNTWYGIGGTPLAAELAEGWMAVVDPVADVTLATTWDLENQRQHMASGITAARGGFFTNRFTFEVFYQIIPAGETLEYTQSLIVDDSIPDVSYAKEGQLIAGISMNAKQFDPAASPIATFRLNSLNPNAAATYDLRNLRVEDAQTQQPFNLTLADITNINVPANGHVVAGTRQFPLNDPSLVPGRSYVIKADLHAAGNGTPITTLSSRAFLVDADKVRLYEDPTSGDLVLENEVYRFTVSASTGQLIHFVLKTAGNRNQTITSIPSYPLFRDRVQPETSAMDFSGYVPTSNPNNDNSPTRKSISFSGFSVMGQLTRTYTLESNSRSLKVDLEYTNGADPLVGGGLYSEVTLSPSGNSNVGDTVTAHAAGSLLTIHPETNTQTKRYFMGAAFDPSGNGTAVAGELPELDQGWIAATDPSPNDVVAVAWDLARQRQFSLTPAGASAPVTMNSLLINANYAAQIAEVRWTNIPANATVKNTMYLIGDSGYEIVGYVEANRVMAGIWPDVAEAPAGSTLNIGATLTNTGTTSRTFDLKNIRIVTGETSTAAGADQTGIALAAAAQATRTVAFAVPAGQAAGSYRILADLYEGTTRITTLESLPFSITAPVVTRNGDVNGDTLVNASDVILALQISAGLATSDAGNVSRGDIFPAPGGNNALTLEDAVSILRKM